MSQEKNALPKTVAEACHVLSKSKTHLLGKYNNKKSESNDGIAFATVTEEKQQQKSKKKKEITCFRCKIQGITPVSAKKNCPRWQKVKMALAAHMREDSSDKEPLSEDQYGSEEDNNVTWENQHSDGEAKDDNALDEDEITENESYKDNDMCSEDDYEGFAFVQDMAWNINDKAGIPDSWIFLYSQSTVEKFTDKKILKNTHDAEKVITVL